MIDENNNVSILMEKELRLGVNKRATIDDLDGNYSRLPLNYIEKGLRLDTFAKIFYLSAKKEESGKERLENQLKVLVEMVKDGSLPFPLEETQNAVVEWSKKGYPALRHSDRFKEIYNPQYRVVSNVFIKYLDLFMKIDALLKKGRAVVAIDGKCGSGKSTLANLLFEIYDGSIFHVDDYFLRPEQRTSARLNEIGGNFDRERFEKEIILPLKTATTLSYSKYDCTKNHLLPAQTVTLKPLIVIEGAYSLHPELEKYYDLAVFLDLSPTTQLERIKKRCDNSEVIKRFENEWIPLENEYFNAFQIKNRCDISYYEE